ncbi:MAG: hypothetical protein IT523_13405 [Burkholderiales bacterium]|nr:hypothetical protein [Pseudomonadota bacterium]MCC7069429.1 hypothetical protein [Burkholderiales bacterium]MCZ2136320.1 hypothetical protein [Burkholderiales bacterium]
MSGFLYFACVLTGLSCGGALGVVIGTLLAGQAGRWPGGIIGAVILTTLLLRLGRKLRSIFEEAPPEDRA